MRLASAFALVMAALLAGMPAGGAPASYGFTVRVTLSQKAATELKRRGEAIVVSALFTGEPVASQAARADMSGGVIYLGNEDVTIPGTGGIAHIRGDTVVREKAGWAKAVNVTINVYTARKTDPYNLIACSLTGMPLAKAQAEPVPVSCRLIGEN
jgi:hypothetical protein